MTLEQKILVVDDDQAVRNLVEKIVKTTCKKDISLNNQYEVLTASNLNTALSIIEAMRKSLALIITDMDLDEGGEGLKIIKKAQELDLSVISMSGTSYQEKTDELGVDFVKKPFTLKEISDPIKTHLLKNRSQISENSFIKLIDFFENSGINLNQEEIKTLHCMALGANS